MSVWVTWKDSTSNEWLFDKVRILEENADVTDLRKAFLKEQKLEIGPATVEVRELEGGEKLEEDDSLTPYFVTGNKEDKSLPGRSKAGALVLTLKQQPNGRGEKRKVFFTDEMANKRVKFYNSISTATSSANSITFAESILGDDASGAVLFKRDCYTALFKLVEERREKKDAAGVVITGTPGIGKTMFGIQCIRTYAVENELTVLYKFRSEGYVLFTSQKVWHVGERSYELPGEGPFFSGKIGHIDSEIEDFIDSLKAREDVIYIVDLDKKPFEESISVAFTIILSSSNREKYSAAISSSTLPVIVLWMETWSKPEIEQHFDGKINNLAERFARHGGIPRYLLWSEAIANSDLTNVLDSTTSEEFQVALDPNCKFEKFNGRLVHYSKVSENRETATATFASREVMKRVAARFYLRERLSFQVTIDKLKFHSDFGSARGVLSELVWHHSLREGGSDFQLKNLTTCAPIEVLKVAKFDGSVILCENDMRDLSNLSEGDYVSPFGNAFPAVDAFMVTRNPFFEHSYQKKVLVGFQMAGSKQTSGQHWLKGCHVVNWINKVRQLHNDLEKVVIVFVVNNEDLSSWSAQAFKTNHNESKTWKNYTKLPKSLLDIEQYALGIQVVQRDVEPEA